MMQFESKIINKGIVTFPNFSGTRIMMMPFLLEAPEATLPEFATHYIKLLSEMITKNDIKEGIAYLTIDEAYVKKNTTHRRPGVHVDGIDENGLCGGWGGGGWGCSGMLQSSTVMGCKGWNGTFNDFPLANGDCVNLLEQLSSKEETYLIPNNLYQLNSMAVHESIPQTQDGNRQFIRLSNPNNGNWYKGYTENPLGIKPTGKICASRTEFMNFRN